MSSWNWPSREKLQQLRIRGVLPYSSFSTRCFLFASALFLLGFLSKKLGALREHTYQAWTQESFSVFSLGTKAIWEDFLSMFTWITAVLAGTILLIGLLQNRFLFNPGLIRFQWSRDRLGLLTMAGRSLVLLLFCAVLMMICCSISYNFLVRSYPLVAALRSFVVDPLSPGSLETFGMITAAVLVGIGVLWWFVQWVHFLWTHRTLEGSS